MFWKKKKEEQQPVVDTVKPSTTRYMCLGLSSEIKDNDEFEIMEMVVEKAKTKVYTDADLDQMTKVLEFDVRKGLVWIDEDWVKKNGMPKRTMGMKKRLVATKEPLTNEECDKLEKYLPLGGVFSGTEIMKAQMHMGFQFQDHCDFENYMYTEYQMPDGTVKTTYEKHVSE